MRPEVYVLTTESYSTKYSPPTVHLYSGGLDGLRRSEPNVLVSVGSAQQPYMSPPPIESLP